MACNNTEIVTCESGVGILLCLATTVGPTVFVKQLHLKCDALIVMLKKGPRTTAYQTIPRLFLEIKQQL